MKTLNIKDQLNGRKLVKIPLSGWKYSLQKDEFLKMQADIQNLDIGLSSIFKEFRHPKIDEVGCYFTCVVCEEIFDILQVKYNAEDLTDKFETLTCLETKFTESAMDMFYNLTHWEFDNLESNLLPHEIPARLVQFCENSTNKVTTLLFAKEDLLEDLYTLITINIR